MIQDSRDGSAVETPPAKRRFWLYEIFNYILPLPPTPEPPQASEPKSSILTRSLERDESEIRDDKIMDCMTGIEQPTENIYDLQRRTGHVGDITQWLRDLTIHGHLRSTCRLGRVGSSSGSWEAYYHGTNVENDPPTSHGNHPFRPG